MKRLENKVAVITGSNSGVGKECAKLFVKEGCKVVICARREEQLKEVKDEVIKLGGEVLEVRCDISIF